MIALLALLACSGDAKIAFGDTGTPLDTATHDTADTSADTAPPDTGDTAEDPVLADAFTITVHPEVATILVVSWNQLSAGDTWLSWELDGETHTSPVRPREAGAASEVVLGLPPDTTVPLTLHVSVGGVDTPHVIGDAATDPLPAAILAPTLTLSAPGADPAPYLLTSVNVGPQNFFGPCAVVILDREGRVVWYRLVSDRRLTLFPRVAKDGTHILWDATTYYVAGTPSITRATLSLSHSTEIDIPSMGFTYDELPDGSFLYDEAESGYAYHLARRRPDGTDERIWSCAPWMSSYSNGYWACAPNTVLWDPATNLVYWSMFETSTVVALDLDTGAMAWELGQYTGGLAFSPSDIRIELQHYPNPTPDGTLLLTAHVPGRTEQHIREFSIAGGVATQVWDYVAEAGYYGVYAGEATRLPEGNTLVNFGTDGVLQEITPDKQVVWEIDWANHLPGHATPLDDLYALDRGW